MRFDPKWQIFVQHCVNACVYAYDCLYDTFLYFGWLQVPSDEGKLD